MFGGASVGSSGTIELSALDGIDGFASQAQPAADSPGRAVSGAGDVNGDRLRRPAGRRALNADPTAWNTPGRRMSSLGGERGQRRRHRVQRTGWQQWLPHGRHGGGNQVGYAVSGAGDVNGEASRTAPWRPTLPNPNGSASGAAYVVWGGRGWAAVAPLPSGRWMAADGFVMQGRRVRVHGPRGERGGRCERRRLRRPAGRRPLCRPERKLSGAAYVVFGGAGVGSEGTIALGALDGSDGFRLNGAAEVIALALP